MANLPVETMQTGGLLWFPDLTLADPLHLLPFLTSATLLATIEVKLKHVVFIFANQESL